jgi:uncharacterized protein YndB with AHSA1/START domain
MTETEARRGSVTPEDDGRLRLEFRRSWPDPIEDVWSALTEPERLLRWIGSFDGERTPGGEGTFTMTHEAEPIGEAMRIVECRPPTRLVVEWLSEEGWRVELDLAREGDRTVLLFRQWFAAGTDVVDFAMGWHWYLDKFSAEVGGDAAPGAWDDFLAVVGPAYGRTPAT